MHFYARFKGEPNLLVLLCDMQPVYIACTIDK